MAGLQPDIYAAIGITWVAAFLALSLRLKARRMTKMNLWFDDYFAIIALSIPALCIKLLLRHDILYATSSNIDRSRLLCLGTHSYKLGQSILTIGDPNEANRIQDRSRLLLWICELLYASSIAFCKLSILCFYWRVFQYTSIRYAIIILLVAVSIWITIRTFIVIFHCVPIRAYWDKSIQGAKCPFNEANFFFATILIHTTMDCVILILPVIEVMKMSLPLSQRLAVVGLFTSGTMYVELLLDMAQSMMWAAVEINMAVFSCMD
ncbi:integral membrane protein [Fusarium sp. NRRL 52700]|nr:integral membrane protein [Fusarium sp. NRRL 52700]